MQNNFDICFAKRGYFSNRFKKVVKDNKKNVKKLGPDVLGFRPQPPKSKKTGGPMDVFANVMGSSDFAKMKAGSATTFQKLGFHMQRYVAKGKIMTMTLTGHFQTMFAMISRAGAATMTFLGKVMGAAGVLGIVIMVVSSIVQIINTKNPFSFPTFFFVFR